MLNFRLWYKFWRRHTKPIPGDKAVIWKRRLSLLYAFLSFNAFGMILILIGSGYRDMAEYTGVKSEEEKMLTPGQLWAKNLNIQNANIIRMSGLRKIGECTLKDGEFIEGTSSEQSSE